MKKKFSDINISILPNNKLKELLKEMATEHETTKQIILELLDHIEDIEDSFKKIDLELNNRLGNKTV